MPAKDGIGLASSGLAWRNMTTAALIVAYVAGIPLAKSEALRVLLTVALGIAVVVLNG